MTLIKSISGIRGTIGGRVGENLTPVDAALFAGAYAKWLKELNPQGKIKVVIGRDARPSGAMLQSIVQNVLVGSGLDVVDLDLSTTPTVEMAVVDHQAQGGIILTASHNPVQWNALKLLNHRGEFISKEDGATLLAIIEAQDFSFVPVQELGEISHDENAIDRHIEAILKLPFIDADQIAQANLKVAVDAVNSSGALAIPPLLEKLGVKDVTLLYGEPNGLFPHNPEPLKEHLSEIMATVHKEGCDLGIVVDPDVDRLAFISENGEMFGEEYTLVAAADFLLRHKKGGVVSNMSSSRALRDIAHAKGVSYQASAVGEVNVVHKMKETEAVLGGEGNGGVILPDLHYGRDALVGIAMVLNHLAASGKKMSELRASYPEYYMAKQKAQLQAGMDVDGLLQQIAEKYRDEEISTLDGVKIDFPEHWVHLRKSNTEPIIRIYSEAKSQAEADELASKFQKELADMAGA